MKNPTFQSLEPSGATDLRQQLGRQRTDLMSNATFLTFDPGLYAIDFATNGGSMSDVGLPLPCARLEPVPMPSSTGRAFVSMLPEGGWISRHTTAAHVLVVGGKAGAVLTIYRPADGSALPEVRFRSVLTTAPEATPAPASQVASPSDKPTPTSTVKLLVHLQAHGDQTSSDPSGWVGDTRGEHPLEGFSITMPDGISSTDFEYQGIMGEDWRTPWFPAGVFCGSRGLQLPLLGFRLRLTGRAAEQFDCVAWGHFASLGQIGPIKNGEDCLADLKPLTAIKVEILPKSTQAATPAPPAPATSRPTKRSFLRKPKAP